MKKRVLTVMMALLMVIAYMPVFSYAVTDGLACESWDGTNVNAQDYDRWTTPTESYLTKTDDGYMRVQGGASDGTIRVAYYDDAFNITSRRAIPAELPLFGGFYESADNYFVVTGQTNPDQSDSVEVFRITKYDKSWNRLDSCGLSDCNTTVPFDAGSCRMDMQGDYLVIHTSHEMYKSSDGYNHQANVTMIVDTAAMTIKSSRTAVMNSSAGYVSHSFNQFVKIDNGHIVTVDHGDAHPRSICLGIYSGTVASGSVDQFNNVEMIDVLPIEGETGDNTTGATVGGFEISGSSYLIAGSSVTRDENFDSYKTRNVFVAAVDKNTKAVKINWITNYAEGEESASTPQLVKTNDNMFVVLWNRDGKYNYTYVNGKGERIMEAYEQSIEGSLSDCQPIVTGDKVEWYTWKDGEESRYQIMSDWGYGTSFNITNRQYGHKWNWVSTDNGIATRRCSVCNEVETGRVPTAFRMLWRDPLSEDTYYYSVPPSGIQVGGTVRWMWSGVTYPDGDGEIFDEFSYEVNNPTKCVVDLDKKTIKFLEGGTYTITFYPTYNPDLRQTYTFRIVEPVQSVLLNVSPGDSQEYGMPVTLSAFPDGGIGKLTYTFWAIDETEDGGTIAVDTTKSSVTWNPPHPGTYTLRVDVKDAGDNDKVTSSEVVTYEVRKAAVTVKGGKQITADPITYGQMLGEANIHNNTFVRPSTGETVEGTFTLESSDESWPAGTYDVGWTFVPNNENYETLTGSVRITVNKADVVVTEVPTNTGNDYNPFWRLEDVDLIGGSAATADGTAVPGTFQWKDPATKLTVPGGTYTCEFVPDDQANYNTAEMDVDVEIRKATPNVIYSLHAQPIVYGQTLSDSVLTGEMHCMADADVFGFTAPGHFEWVEPETRPTVADSGVTGYSLVFIPDDTDNINTKELITTVEVSKAPYPTPSPADWHLLVYPIDTVDNSILGVPNWTFAEEDLGMPLEVNKSYLLTAYYTGDDAENYETTTKQVELVRDFCDHERTWEVRDAVEPTCEEPGYSGDTYCRDCGEKTITGQEIPALGHDWDDGAVTVAPTCVTTGERTYTCSRCGATRTEEISADPANHVHQSTTPAVKATDSEDGATESIVCDDCGTVVLESEAVPQIDTVTLSKTSYTYSGSANKPAVTVTDTAGRTIDAANFTVSYSNNTNAAAASAAKAPTATVKFKSDSPYAGTISKSFTISPKSITKCTFPTIADKVYTGSALKPALTLKDGTKTLAKYSTSTGTGSYTVTYSNNTKVGKAKVVIKGKGNYTGTKTLYFKINPKGTSIASVTAASKGFTVKWKKQSTQTTGYQIYYTTSTTAPTKSTTPKATISSTSTLSKKVTGLKGSKKYYVYVRTYKTVNGVKYYSKWSAKGTVTTKK